MFLGLSGTLDTYEAHGGLETWLKKLTTRVVLTRWREREREISLLAWSRLVPRARPVDPIDRIALERAIAALPWDLCAVFMLHETEGRMHQEIGDLLGIRESASGQRLYHARRRLRSALGTLL